MAWAITFSRDSPKLVMAVWGRVGQMTPEQGPPTIVWGSNNGTKEIRKLQNSFFPSSLTQEGRGTLDNQDKRAGKKNEAFYTEVVSSQ